MADDDQRDERGERDDQIGALLEVEPLDEVTRRRLVATALATAPTAAATSRRWLAAAAVLLVVVGGGGALLATAGGGRNDQPTAAPALTPAQKGAQSATPTAPPAAPGLPQTDSQSREAVPGPAIAGTPLNLGDFGDLTNRKNLDRLRKTLKSSTFSDLGSGGGADELQSELATRTCAARLPAGTMVALATGRYGKRAAIVVAIDLTSGGRSIEAVISHPCEVRKL